MPIAINGSGTLTGVSVGGLPDGIVDTDMLADDAVTAAKSGAGAIVQVTNTTTDTIQTISASSAWVDSSITCAITPSSASNKILISLSVSGEGNASDQNRFVHRIKKVISGGATTYIAGSETDRVGLLGRTGDLTQTADTSASSFSISNYMDAPSTTSAVTYTCLLYTSPSPRDS